MNAAHFHLLVNHLPIMFPLIGGIVFAVGLFFKNEPIKRTSFFIILLGGISTALAMFSGEGAEEIAEKIPGITKKIIHEHEEAAEVFALLNYILALLAGFNLWASLKGKLYAKYLNYAIIAGLLLVLFLAKQTGTSGGEIRHTEIREGGNIGTQESGVSDQHEE